MGGIIPFALQLLSAIPGLFASGEQAIAMIEANTAALKAMVAENRSPTQAEWDALNSVLSGLEAQLDAPVEPVVAPVEPVVAPVEPVVAPVEPVVAPVEPVVAPVEPVVAPVEPVVAPVEPVVAPAANPEPIAPAEPQVPDAPQPTS